MGRCPLRDDENGATSVDYALLAVLIAMAIFAAVSAFGINLSDLFSNADLNNALTN